MELTKEQFRELVTKAATEAAESAYIAGQMDAASGIRMVAEKKPEYRKLLLAVAESIEEVCSAKRPSGKD